MVNLLILATAGVQGICPQVCPGRLESYQWFVLQCAIAFPPQSIPHAVQSGGMVCLWYSDESTASEEVSRYQSIRNYCIMTSFELCWQILMFFCPDWQGAVYLGFLHGTLPHLIEDLWLNTEVCIWSLQGVISPQFSTVISIFLNVKCLE